MLALFRSSVLNANAQTRAGGDYESFAGASWVEVRSSIEEADCQLMLLPSYSPDLNLVEFTFL